MLAQTEGFRGSAPTFDNWCDTHGIACRCPRDFRARSSFCCCGGEGAVREPAHQSREAAEERRLKGLKTPPQIREVKPKKAALAGSAALSETFARVGCAGGPPITPRRFTDARGFKRFHMSRAAPLFPRLTRSACADAPFQSMMGDIQDLEVLLAG
jgi:hypothetical protein